MVRQLMVVLLPGGRCTSQRVAQHLGVDRRTLHRHLERENTTFSGLLQETRVTLAQRLVGRTAQPLAGVALLMGFASPSAFAYWFNRSFGCGARVWRQRQMDVDARLHRGGAEGAGSAPSVSPLA
jgi:transcriptional regulator GlxA family with amidase domain